MKPYAQRGDEAVVFDLGDGLGAMVDVKDRTVYPARIPLMGIIKFGYWEAVTPAMAKRAEALIEGIDPRTITSPVRVAEKRDDK